MSASFLTGELRVHILPLQKGAPIDLASQAVPDYQNRCSPVRLMRAELVSHAEVIY